MLEFMIDNIFAMLGGRVFFQKRVGIYIWEQAVLLFTPTCSFIRIKQISFRSI